MSDKIQLEVLVVRSGRLSEVRQVDGEYRVADEDLPVTLRVAAGAELSQVGSAGHWFREDSAGADAYGRRLFRWNPYLLSSEEELRSQWCRMTYGIVFFDGEIDGVPVRKCFRILPNRFDERRLTAMRDAIRQIRAELVWRWLDGSTHESIASAPDRPTDLVSTQAILRRRVRGALPAVRRVGRRPLEEFAPSATGRRPGERPVPGGRAASRDIPENRIAAAAARAWLRMIAACARAARGAAAVEESEVEEYGRRGGLAPEGWLDYRHERCHRWTTVAAELDDLEAELRRAASPGLRSVSSRSALGISPTPRILGSPDYSRILREFRATRREFIEVGPDSVSTLPLQPASMLFEYWALLALTRLLLDSSWILEHDLLDSIVADGVYEVTLPEGQPFVFRRDRVRLTLVYQPLLTRVASHGSRTNTIAVRRRSTRAVPPGVYTTARSITPDYLMVLESDDGRSALLVGDAIYSPRAPYLDRSGRLSDTDSVRKKLEMVSDKYALRSWAVLPDGSVLEANPEWSFVVYPGDPGRCRCYDGEVVGLAMPLLPLASEGDRRCVEDEEGVGRRLDAFLADLIEHMPPPRTRVPVERRPMSFSLGGRV